MGAKLREHLRGHHQTEKRKKPFYQRLWFTWACLLCAAPLGIVLLWRNRHFPAGKSVLLSLLFLGLSFSFAWNVAVYRSDPLPVTVISHQSTDAGDSRRNGSAQAGIAQAHLAGSASDLLSNSETVYMSQSGTRYHKIPNCGTMRVAIAISRSEAEAQGLTACRRCFP